MEEEKKEKGGKEGKGKEEAEVKEKEGLEKEEEKVKEETVGIELGEKRIDRLRICNDSTMAPVRFSAQETSENSSFKCRFWRNL